MTRGSIGIKYSNSDKATRANLQIAGVSEGVFVNTVQPGGPAEKAGIKDGDMIVSINGKPVRDGNDLVNSVVSTPVGTTVDLGVVRDGKRSDYKVAIGDIARFSPKVRQRRAQPGAPKPEGETLPPSSA